VVTIAKLKPDIIGVTERSADGKIFDQVDHELYIKVLNFFVRIDLLLIMELASYCMLKMNSIQWSFIQKSMSGAELKELKVMSC